MLLPVFSFRSWTPDTFRVSGWNPGTSGSQWPIKHKNYIASLRLVTNSQLRFWPLPVSWTVLRLRQYHCKVPEPLTYYTTPLSHSPLLFHPPLILGSSLVPTSNTCQLTRIPTHVPCVLLLTTACIPDTTPVDRPISRFSSDVYKQGLESAIVMNGVRAREYHKKTFDGATKKYLFATSNTSTWRMSVVSIPWIQYG